ncbi:RPEL repeat protein, partial [Metarhizium brunneum ARSEF 3297]
MSEPAAVEQQPQRVDETPISPIRPDAARKNSLENHLMHRPNRAELVEKLTDNYHWAENILPASSAAPGLLAHQKELERSMLEDKLNDKISHRPSPEALVKGGVLHEDPRTADQQYEEAIEDEYAKREGGA